jgi:hypothetical protein
MKCFAYANGKIREKHPDGLKNSGIREIIVS